MDASGATNPLCGIAGWHLDTLLTDLMHVGPLGSFQVAAGSTLVELCSAGRWGDVRIPGGWKLRLQLQLRLAYAEFSAFCKRRGLTSSQPPFTASSVSMNTSTDFPLFKGKAGNTMVRWACQCTDPTVRHSHT
eukprot:7583708-Alexandrium_andersonii.AAC.1